MIKLENISKSYVNGALKFPVLKHINLNINKSEFVSIMGPSGSGKSSLMNIIGLLDRATEGNYILNNKKIDFKNEVFISGFRNQSIGFVFKHFQLLSRSTALENVELPL
ncbi:ATP-binding cassette domain-containing protein [Bacillus sp. V3B]|uniref:ATP-binding cassette domain-containing protein n=1 Tax=Bacillus sp. V3B TaxID=2804915 RepID=UPI002109C0ED|nr:ATP-binding cassette domain-containing protein [Bacillus sp. V3B]MCQ6277576.1 ATP-binding cassette domain-containing protein [Bacillus sp. V3B]